MRTIYLSIYLSIQLHFLCEIFKYTRILHVSVYTNNNVINHNFLYTHSMADCLPELPLILFIPVHIFIFFFCSTYNNFFFFFQTFYQWLTPLLRGTTHTMDTIAFHILNCILCIIEKTLRSLAWSSWTLV